MPAHRAEKSNKQNTENVVHFPDGTAQQARSATSSPDEVEHLINAKGFGRVDQFKVPFSEQQKDEIHSKFPKEKAFFQSLDERISKINKAHKRLLKRSRQARAGLALLVFSLFLFHLSGLLAALVVYVGPTLAVSASMLSTAIAGIGSIALCLGFAFALPANQAKQYEQIRNQFRELSIEVKAKHDGLDKNLMELSRLIQKRTGSEDWPQLALQYTRAFLYAAELKRYLDVYATTVFWKQRRNTWRFDIESRIEYGGMSFVLTVLYVTAAIAMWQSNSVNFLGSIALCGVLMLWSLTMKTGTKIDEEFWQNEFGKVFDQKHEFECRHEIETLSEVVESLVETIQANDRQKG